MTEENKLEPQIYYKKNGKRYEKFAEDFMGFPKFGIWEVKDGLNNDIEFIGSQLQLDFPVIELKKKDVLKAIKKKFGENFIASGRDIAEFLTVYLYQKFSGNKKFNINFLSKKAKVMTTEDEMSQPPLYEKEGRRYYEIDSTWDMPHFPADGIYFTASGMQECLIDAESMKDMPEDFIPFLMIKSMLGTFYRSNLDNLIDSMIQLVSSETKERMDMYSKDSMEDLIMRERVMIQSFMPFLFAKLDHDGKEYLVCDRDKVSNGEDEKNLFDFIMRDEAGFPVSSSFEIDSDKINDFKVKEVIISNMGNAPIAF